MAELRKEASGPAGDPARYRPLAELEAGLRALPTAPRDPGRLALIVRRRADGVRETPPRVRLLPGEGVPGDGWIRRPPHDPEAQLAVMRRDASPRALGSVPCTYVELLQDRALPPAVQERMAKGGVAWVVSIDCGHTVMLARPVELASVLNEVADRLEAAWQSTA